MAERNTTVRTWVRRVKKFLKWTGLVLLGASLAAYVYVRMDILSHANRLDAEITKARNFGLPLTPAEMDRRSSIALDDNAADDYSASAAEMEAAGSSWLEVAINYDGIYTDANYRKRFRSGLDKLKPSLDRVRSASTRPSCAYEIDWKEAPYIEFGDTINQKRFVKFLTAEALLFSIEGEWEQAIQNLATVARIIRHSGEDRMIISLLVACAYDAILTGAIEELSSRMADNLIQLKKLREAVASMPSIPGYKHYLVGEVFFSYWGAKHLRKNWGIAEKHELENPDFDLISNPGRYEVFPPLIEVDLVQRAASAEILGFWNETFRLLDNEGVPATKIHERMDQLVEKVEANAKPWRRTAAMTLPIYASSNQALYKARIVRSCQLALIDVLIARATKGKTPTSLSEARVSETDPVTGETLKYKVTKTGFRVYAAGPNGNDFGGLTIRELNALPLRERGHFTDQGNLHIENIVAVYPTSDRSLGRDMTRSISESNKYLDRFFKHVDVKKPIQRRAQ